MKNLTTRHEKTAKKAYKAGAKALTAQVVACLRRKKTCVLGIVGGRATPHVLRQLLPHASRLKSKGSIHVLWLDERVRTQKNYQTELPVLKQLQKAGIPIISHPLTATTEEGILQQAKETLRIVAATAKRRDITLDLLLLSAGEDDHIASLFPHHKELHRKEATYVIVRNAPKPPRTRISATIPLLLSAKCAVLLFIGHKREAYETFITAHQTIDNVPAQIVRSIPQCTVVTHLT